MALFVPTTENFRTAVEDRKSLRYIKVLIDIDDDDVLEDVTSKLDSNYVQGGGSGQGELGVSTKQYSVKLRNSDQTYADGDFAGAICAIEAQVGSTEYVRIFTGIVSDEGCQRSKKTKSDDVVTIRMHDSSKSRGMRVKPRPTTYIGYKICDTVTPAASLFHQLAYLLGLSESDLVTVTIDQTKDYLPLDGKVTAWQELQNLCAQYIGHMCFRYDGKLLFVSRHQTGWTDPTSEWTFDDSNIHSWNGRNSSVVCNKVKTVFEKYENLGARTIYKNTDDWDSTNERNAITIAAGDYWPGPNSQDLARLMYKDPASGESFPIGISIQPPSIGAVGSGSDIECEGGLLTLISFNGSTGDTHQNPGSSEIILRNNTGSTITIRKFIIRGTPLRIQKKCIVEDVDADIVDDWDYIEKTISGKYAVSDTQAHISTQRWLEFGKVPRKIFDFVTDWIPQIQEGAVVTFNPDASIDLSGVVESYSHTINGPYRKWKTKISIREKEDFTPSGDANVVEEDQGDSATETAETFVTHEEAQNGYDDAPSGGTTTPTQPTANAQGYYKTIVIKWDRQLNLTNFDHYEIQVSEDQSDWYSLAFDGEGAFKGWGGALAGLTEVPIEYILHENIPAGGTEDNPTATTLYYRVRRVTKAADNSDWSAIVNGSTAAIASGDILVKAISAAKVDAENFLLLNETGLVGYWSLDDGSGVTALDQSGNKNNGTLEGSAPTWVDGISGKAVNFPGTNERLDCGNGAPLDEIGNGSFSISFWMKSKDTVPLSNGRLFDKVETGNNYILLDSFGTANRFRFGLKIGNIGAIANFSEDTAPFDTNWNHIALIINRTTDLATLYMNTIKDATEIDLSSCPANCSNTANVAWGGKNDGANPYEGYLDELRIYNRVLTEAEIKYLYMNPSGNIPAMFAAERIIAESITTDKLHAEAVTAEKIASLAITTAKLSTVAIKAPTEGLVGWWTLDDGSGTTAIDSSGNGNDGTLTAGAGAWEDGKSGKAYHFDGAASFIDLTTEYIFQAAGAWSISHWFKSDDVSILQNFLSSEANYNLKYWGITGSKLAIWGITEAGWRYGDTTLVSDTWYHVVLVHNGSGQLKYYLNADLDATHELTTAECAGRFRHIGVWSDRSSRFFGGIIDELRIYNRALTHAEVLALYIAPGGYNPGLITTDRLQAGSVVADKIEAGTITAVQMAATALEALYAKVAYVLTIGQDYTGDPVAGNQRLRLDKNEFALQEYDGSAWKAITQFGGDDSLKWYLQSRGLIKTGTDISGLVMGHKILSSSADFFDFEDDYKDQNENDPWDTKKDLSFSSSFKFGTKALVNATDKIGVLRDLAALGITNTDFSLAGWHYKPSVSTERMLFGITKGGITWTIRTSAADNSWFSVCWSPELSLFCAVADSGIGNRVMTSPDGITWTIRTSAADNNWLSVCWSPELSLFCAVAANGTGNRVMTSPDGITWTIRTSAADNSWLSVCWSPELSLFCAVAYSGTDNRVMTSPDGITWTIRTSEVLLFLKHVMQQLLNGII